MVNIPLPCPDCDGKMYAVRYDTPLKILKDRSWQVCKECGFQRSIDDFKRSLLTA